MKGNKYVLKKRKQPFFAIVKKVIKVFAYGKVEVINLAGELSDKCIFVANHAGMEGPMALELFLPKKCGKWCVHEMLGNYRTRRKYLRDVFFMTEQGMPQRKAAVNATFNAIVSKRLYVAMNFIPSYPDVRFAETVENSIKTLENGIPMMIFPENATKEHGFLEEIKEFQLGFVALAEQYYKKTGEDLPIYPVYYHHEKRKLVIGQPKYVQEMKENGAKRKDVAQMLCNEVNGLFCQYIKTEGNKA